MSDTVQIENEISHYKGLVAMRDALLKLETNREYKKLFLEGLFKDEPARLVKIAKDPRLTDEGREEVEGMFYAISYLHQYLHKIVMEGMAAENAITEAEEYLADLETVEAA